MHNLHSYRLLNRIFDCSIRVSHLRDLGGRAKQALGGPRSCQACLWLCHCLKLMYLVFNMLQLF